MPAFYLGRLVLTLLIGCVGGFIALRLKIPAGGLVGAMFSVAIFNVFTGYAVFPWYTRVMTQAIAGAFFAVPLTLAKLKAMYTVLKPAFIVVGGMLAFSVTIGFLCLLSSPIDPVTAFFSTAPGGITDIVLISADLGANLLQVSVIHSMRIFLVLSIFPIVNTIVANYIIRKYPALCESRQRNNVLSEQEAVKGKENKLNLALSLFVALLGGGIGYFLKIPAGAITFSLLFMCVFNIATNRGYIPVKLRRFTQICAGSLIGSYITMAHMISIRYVIVPLVIIIAGNMVMNLVLGLATFRFTRLDIHTAMFCSVPAGVADMALIATEHNGDGAKVALIQTFRLISTIAIFPQVYMLIVRHL